MRKTIAILILLCLALTLFAGCSNSSDQKGAIPPIVVYDIPFSEGQLVHRMVKLLVETHTDVTMEIRDAMSTVNNYKEVVKGGADLMNCYDGSLLTTYLKPYRELDPQDVPEGMTLYDFANENAMELCGVRLLKPLGHNNTYVLAVPEHIVEKYQLKTISDLVPVAGELVFGAEHEFFSDAGSMRFGPLTEFYGLKFKDSLAIDLALKYTAVETGRIDVTEVYSTDGLNKKAKLVLLEDDKKFFPEYNGGILVRNDLFERYADVAPDLEEVLNKLAGLFTNEIMTELTYQVDVEGRSPDEVAKEFLQSKNLIP